MYTQPKLDVFHIFPKKGMIKFYYESSPKLENYCNIFNINLNF